MSVFVIAEAGVNHNGERGLALALVDAAAEAGADAVKFQTFKADDIVTAGAPKAAYQEGTTQPGETHLQMLKRLELSRELHRDLVGRCQAKGIAFLSSPFDLSSLKFLVDKLLLKTLKIPSGEITNGPLLLAAGESGCDIILSTGMSTLDEVAQALGVLAFGLTGGDAAPSLEAFGAAFASAAGKAACRDKVTLLHCTSEYPAPFSDANLRAMDTMADAFGLRVGLSDHTPGTAIPIAAAARGAGVIEKHFTTDRGLPGPDHKASLEPDELRAMVEGIRAVEEALGDGVKEAKPSEIRNIEIARKSLLAIASIRAGEAFTEDNLGAKRPGTGISPMAFWERLGRKADRDYAEGEQL